MLSAVFLFLNIGTGEMVLILFVALMLFGGNKLPELARGLGKGIRDFKDASEDVKREINNQINNYQDKKVESEVTEVKPIEDTHEQVAGTLPAFEGHTATDAIEETAVAEEVPATDVVTEPSAEDYHYEAEVEHPVTAQKSTVAEADKADEPVKKTIEEEYK